MGILKIIRKTNDGLNYMYNALNYVLGIHTDYDKRYSPNTDINDAYNQFLIVKKYYGKTGGNPVFHFIVSYDSKTTYGNDYDRAAYLSRRIAEYFSAKNYQVVYGIHCKSRKKCGGYCASFYHTHFIVNSVNYYTGKMYPGNKMDEHELLSHIKNITGDPNWIIEYDTNSNIKNPFWSHFCYV